MDAYSAAEDQKQVFSWQFLKPVNFLSELINLAPALRNQVSQNPKQEIALGTKALYPLIAQDLKNLSNKSK